MTDKNITDKKYELPLRVWNTSRMKMMKNNHDLYLKCDVLLLADVFEIFRNGSLKNYVLSPSCYLITPALSWEAMLNTTKNELELISDVDVRWSFTFLRDIVKPTLSI